MAGDRSNHHAAHPWHGVSPGPHAPGVVTVYVEIVPTDTVKYELDKATGILRLDRPQKYSNVCPSLYGFIPRTLCAERVGERCGERTGRTGIVGDGDPMDICVLTERAISHGDILVQARPIGGLRMIDGNEADDKIIAVLPGDAVYGDLQDLEHCPGDVVDRLRHYFLTYKHWIRSRPYSESQYEQAPGRDVHPARPGPAGVEIAEVYGLAEAHEAIRRSLADYDAHHP